MEHGVAVVHISTVHRADDSRICHRECAALAETGYRVSWFAHGSPGGRAGVQHVPLPQYRSRVARFLAGPFRVLSVLLRHRPAIVHLHDPELFWLAGPVRLMRRVGAPTKIMIDLHEDLPAQIRSKGWIPRLARELIAWLSQRYIRICALAADGVIVAGDDIAREDLPVPRTVVRNFPAGFEEWEPRGIGDRPLQVVYAGLVSESRCLESLLTAVRLINDEQPCTLDLYGPFASAATAARAREHPGWSHVRYHGVVPHRTALQAYADANVGLLLLDDEPNHQAVRANKLFELMMVGTPVVGPDFGEWPGFFAAHRCGDSCDVESPPALAAAISRLLSDRVLAESYGRSGRQHIANGMNWEREKEALLDAYREVLGL
jgi:glycosyltransferase involved in cell wall biosynthesis